MFSRKVAPLLAGKKIAIAGGGPSGLTLARLLQMAGGDVEVFDLDASFDARDQGGELDLHEDSGQIAIARADLQREFDAMSRPEAQISKVFDKHGALHLEIGVEFEKETRPEIERRALRKLLINSLKPNTVKWGRLLQRVSRSESGRPRLEFADSAVVEADLLFGCDGVWSRVRPLVTPIKAAYSGLTVVETRISRPEQDARAVAALVGIGTILVTGDDRAIMGQRNGDGHIRVYAYLRVPEDWHRSGSLDFSKPDAVRAYLGEYFKGWAPNVLGLIENTDGVFIPRPLYNVPLDQNWDSQPDIALLGDAAHVMPPWTGKGANYAMLDAVELADKLASKDFASAADAIRAYDKGMIERMHKAVAMTMASQSVMVAPTAPAGIKEVFEERARKAAQRGGR